MYYKQVAEKAYNFILTRLEMQKNMPQDKGGKLREFSKENVELFMDLIYNEFNNYYNTDYSFIQGSNSPVIIGDDIMKESVDRHMYHNKKLILAIECKTYLDKCYMQRADADFDFMKTDLKFKGWIVSLENGIADKSFKFFMNRNHIDKVYYLAIGKRNSGSDKRIYYHPERIKFDLIEKLCKDFEEEFFN